MEQNKEVVRFEYRLCFSKYKYLQPFIEANNNQANFDPSALRINFAGRGANSRSLVNSNTLNLMPRVGVAYQLTPSLVLRGTCPKRRLDAMYQLPNSPQPRAPQRSHCGVEDGLPSRCLSFGDRSSSDKTLPRYSVRAFLYSAMIRGFSFGPASA